MGKIHSSLEYKGQRETERHTLQEGERRGERNVLEPRDILNWVRKIQRALVSSWAATEESVEGEPITSRIQVCTRCIIGAVFCSLQQIVSNEIIFADVATYCWDIIRRQPPVCKCTCTWGRPLIRLCASNLSQNTTHKGEVNDKCLEPVSCCFFFL